MLLKVEYNGLRDLVDPKLWDEQKKKILSRSKFSTEVAHHNRFAYLATVDDRNKFLEAITHRSKNVGTPVVVKSLSRGCEQFCTQVYHATFQKPPPAVVHTTMNASFRSDKVLQSAKLGRLRWQR